MNRLQKRVFIVVTIIVLLIIGVSYSFISYLRTPKYYQESLDELGIIYHCNPYFLIESSLGESYKEEELVVNDSVCKHHGYYSAIKSYSKEPNQIIIDVYFLKESGQNLYTLDNNLIGKYNKLSIKKDILKGSTHRLVYSLKESKYMLVQLEIM